MSSNDPRDPRTGAAVGPEKVVVVRDETVRIPEHTVVVPDAPPAPPPARRRRLVPPGSNTALWVIGFLVALVAIVAVFVWALAPDDAATPGPDVTPVSDSITPDSGVSRGLAIAAPDELRTHTVNVDGDQDLLALSTTAGAADSLRRGSGHGRRRRGHAALRRARLRGGEPELAPRWSCTCPTGSRTTSS